MKSIGRPDRAVILLILLVLSVSGCRKSDLRPGGDRMDMADVRVNRPAGQSQQAEGGRAYLKPDDATLRRKLTPLQYQVTQKEATEPPFQNEYWNNEREGIYVDIVSGEPLFSSKDKFESGTGWPSFVKPLSPENIVEREDRRLLFLKRVEVRSRQGDSHLGHVFDDGPPPTRLRYCMNSAALRFIPKEDLEKEGYGEYRKLFEGEGVSSPISESHS